MPLADAVDGLVHEPTQIRDDAIDLTVASIDRFNGPGAVDFGGDDLEPADRSTVTPTPRDPNDEYGWWDLDAGHYLIEFNESLAADGPATLQPRIELVQRGVVHPTLTVSDLPRVPIVVPPAGVGIKENARVSTLRLD